jgi:hypothetical protein
MSSSASPAVSARVAFERESIGMTWRNWCLSSHAILRERVSSSVGDFFFSISTTSATSLDSVRLNDRQCGSRVVRVSIFYLNDRSSTYIRPPPLFTPWKPKNATHSKQQNRNHTIWKKEKKRGFDWTLTILYEITNRLLQLWLIFYLCCITLDSNSKRIRPIIYAISTKKHKSDMRSGGEFVVRSSFRARAQTKKKTKTKPSFIMYMSYIEKNKTSHRRYI